ncbi:unnamed protein product [Choristocarpus tenellus]
MDECLSTLGGSKYLSCFDIQSAHWQLPITDECERQKAVFITPHGKYEFQRLPFGVQNAKWIFQRFMSETFSSIGPSSGLLIYLDDIVLASPSWSHHKQLINYSFINVTRCRDYVKAVQGSIWLKKIHYVSPQGIAVSQARVEAILEMHPLQTVKGLQSFLGSMNFVTKYIPHLATATEPLVELIRHTQKGKWNRPQQTAFDECNDCYLRLQYYTFLIFLRIFLFM